MTAEPRLRRGTWWTPASPATTTPGMLELVPGSRPRLQTDDHVWPLELSTVVPGVPVPIRVSDFLRQTPIILGMTGQNEPVTLLECSETHDGAEGVTTSATQALVGAHCASHDQALLHSIAGYATHLDEWTATSGFQISSMLDGRTVVEYQTPNTIACPVSATMTVEFGYDVTGPSMTHPWTACTMAQRAVLHIKTTTGTPIDDLLKSIVSITSFVALTLGAPVQITMLRATTETGKAISIHNSLVTATMPPPVGQHEILFALPMIQDRLTTFLQQWMAKHDLLGPVYDLYTSTTSSKTMYVEHQFTSFFQAIESYHRRTNPPAPGTKGAHVTAKNRIMDVIEKHDAAWLFPPPLEDSVRHLVRVRDYFTHFLPEMDVPDLVDVYNLTARLQLLLEIVLFTELGMDHATITSRMQETNRLQRRLATKL
jgi:ApeA N-terminal domain 1